MSENYERQLDVEEQQPKPKRNKCHDCLIGSSLGLIFAASICGALILSGLIKTLPGPYPNTTIAIYVEPVVSSASCGTDGKGTMLGQTGVTYVIQNSTILYYFRQFCGGRNGETKQDFINQLAADYPVNQSVAVWFYPSTLPITYLSNPFQPIETNFFFWMVIACASLILVGVILLLIFCCMKTK